MQASRVNYSKLGPSSKSKSPNEHRNRNTPTPRLDNSNRDISLNSGSHTPNGQSSQNKDILNLNSSYIKNNTTTNNLEYINKLIRQQKSAQESQKQNTVKKNQGHYRNKSSIAGSVNRPFYQNYLASGTFNEPKKGEDRVLTPDPNNQTISTKKDTPSVNLPQFSDHKIEINSHFKLTSPSEYSRLQHNNTPTIKEEKLFENFFQGNDIKKSVSLEDLQIEKKDFGSTKNISNKDGTISKNNSQSKPFNPVDYSYPADKIAEQYASNHQTDKIQEDFLQTPTNFLTSIDKYIKYFDDTANNQNQTQRYFVEEGNGGAGNKTPGGNKRKDMDDISSENKRLKSQLEKARLVINELLASNSALNDSVEKAKTKYANCKERLHQADDLILSLKHKNKYYKEKVSHTKEQLKKDRLEYEDTLVNLRQLVASKFSQAFKHHHNSYHPRQADDITSPKNNKKERHYQKEKLNNLRNFLSEAFNPREDPYRSKSREKRIEQQQFTSQRYENGQTYRNKDQDQRYYSTNAAYYQREGESEYSGDEGYKDEVSRESYEESGEYDESSEPEYNDYDDAPHFLNQQNQPTQRKQKDSKYARQANLHERIAEILNDDQHDYSKSFNSTKPNTGRNLSQSRRQTPEVISPNKGEFRSRQPSWSNAQQSTGYFKGNNNNQQIRFGSNEFVYHSGAEDVDSR